MSKVHERVQFYVITMRCCGHILCVLTRLPQYCPLCGKNIMRDIKAWITVNDDDAMLTYKYHD